MGIVTLAPELTDFQKFIFEQVIKNFESERDICLYEKIKQLIMHKDITSDQKILVTETYDAIRSHLLNKNYAVELKEKTLYQITERGMKLREENVY